MNTLLHGVKRSYKGNMKLLLNVRKSVKLFSYWICLAQDRNHEVFVLSTITNLRGA